MDLVNNNKVFFLRKILVSKFFCYKILSVKNLQQNNNLMENFTLKNQKFFKVKFSVGKLHKYYSRLHLLKKNLLKTFFFFFLSLLKRVFFCFNKGFLFKEFFEKFLFSFVISVLFPKVVDFSKFYVSISLLRKALINIFWRVKSYFFFFFFFIFLFLKRTVKQSLLFTFEFFIDMLLLLLTDKKKNANDSLKSNNLIFFKKEEFLFFYNKKIFKSVFSIFNLYLFP